MEKIPMTRAEYTALETELKHLLKKCRFERPTIIKAIAEAREHGESVRKRQNTHSAKEKSSRSSKARHQRSLRVRFPLLTLIGP